MALLICEKCNQLFLTKKGLDYHTTKGVCAKIKNMCVDCGVKFSSNQCYKYHVDHNVCKKNTQTSVKLIVQNKTPKEMSDEIIRLKGQIDILKEHPQSIINNNTNINNIIVFPQAYGTENMEHIKSVCGDILGKLIRKQTFESIPLLFAEMHNNNALPEYHNVYTRSEKSSFVLKSDGTKFKNHPKKSVIDQIIEDKRSILNQYVDSHEDSLGENILAKHARYQDTLDTDIPFRKNLELEIGGLLLDLKDVISNDNQTRKLLEKVNIGEFELKPL